MQQLQGFGPGSAVGPHGAAQRRGNRLGARGLNTAHGHAQMLGLQHYSNPLRLQVLLNKIGYLSR